MKKIITNLTTIAMVGFFIGAIMVADKTIALNLAAIEVGLSIFLMIVDKDLRRKL